MEAMTIRGTKLPKLFPALAERCCRTVMPSGHAELLAERSSPHLVTENCFSVLAPALRYLPYGNFSIPKESTYRAFTRTVLPKGGSWKQEVVVLVIDNAQLLRMVCFRLGIKSADDGRGVTKVR